MEITFTCCDFCNQKDDVAASRGVMKCTKEVCLTQYKWQLIGDKLKCSQCVLEHEIPANELIER